MFVTYQCVFKGKSDIQHIVVSLMKQRVKLFKSALCSKVTIVMSVAVKDVATSYKHTQFNPLSAELNPICYLLALLGGHHFLHVSRIRVKHASFKLQNSMHLIRISQHFRLLSCPALASEGCRFMWKLCTGDEIMYFLFQIHYSPILFKAQTAIVN